ncbi:MAG TPA: phosphoadenylyl-sulfate reductase [Bacteroidales bacterium]|nr:phosphoadenylyl-sulfate reductase [Bacteroidales bacterium]
MNHNNHLETLNQRFLRATPKEVIGWALNHFGDKIAFSTSMGAEDQVILHMIAGIDKSATVFTLDTGRLFPETYDLIDISSNKYGIPIRIYFPDTKQVEEMVNKKGINLFYESIENRKLCCHIRKVEPLKRAFAGLDAWVCGLRRAQSVTRNDAKMFEWDAKFGLIKINPLINWTEEQLWDFIERNHVPYNKLHDRGFPSIGCQPCTRAVEPGEDVRAGRWWWENPETKECGLHISKVH